MIKAILSSKKTTIALLGFFFLYIFIRSLLVSFTHDEAFTFIHYAATSYQEIWEFEYVTANNHFFNSIATRFIYKLITSEEWSLRLPNTLGFALILYFLFKTFYTQNNYKLLAIPLVLITLSSPYMLEFFSLCRGYGLSIAFLFGGIYQLFQYVNSPSLRRSIYLYLFLLFAVATHLVIVVPFIAITGIFIIFTTVYSFKHKNTSKWANLLLPMVTATTLYLSFKSHVEKLIQEGQLYFGGTNGFYQDTVQTLSWKALYANKYSLLPTENLAILFIGLFIVIGSSLFYKLIQEKFELRSNKAFLIWSILLVCFIGNFLQHELLGSKFLIGRTALYYLFLFLLLLSLSIKEWAEKVHYKQSLLIGGYAIAFVLIFHLIKNSNFNSTLDWYVDANVKNAIELVNNNAPDVERGTVLEVDWNFEPTFNFYNKSRNYWKIKHATRENIQSGGDYYFVSMDSNHAMVSTMELLLEDSTSRTLLYKNNQ